ncbi:hypothetical protein C8F01DRAFT_1079912 [Mycena amicta]|nr:hypothetical protein C8F01DRAFT_1079912 [Mycena amicta]
MPSPTVNVGAASQSISTFIPASLLTTPNPALMTVAPPPPPQADHDEIPRGNQRLIVDGVQRNGDFEIFNRQGAWAMLFGKPLLQAFDAVHDYTTDVLWVHNEVSGTQKSIQNDFYVREPKSGNVVGITTDIKQRAKLPGGIRAPPVRQVHSDFRLLEQTDEGPIQTRGSSFQILGQRAKSPGDSRASPARAVQNSSMAMQIDEQDFQRCFKEISENTEEKMPKKCPETHEEHASSPGDNSASPARPVQERTQVEPIDQQCLQAESPETQEKRREPSGSHCTLPVREVQIPVKLSEARIDTLTVEKQNKEPTHVKNPAIGTREKLLGSQHATPSRRVHFPVDLEIEETVSDDESQDETAAARNTPIPRPLTAENIPRRSYEERAAYRMRKGRRDRKRDRERAKHVDTVGGQKIPPSREVPPHMPADTILADIDVHFRSKKNQGNIWLVDTSTDSNIGDEQPITVDVVDPTILTRKTDPLLAARVEAVMAQVQIGDDLSVGERQRVEEVRSTARGWG